MLVGIDLDDASRKTIQACDFLPETAGQALTLDTRRAGRTTRIEAIRIELNQFLDRIE